MKLTEEGKPDIEDSVHKFFPDAPEAWRPISSDKAGSKEYYGFGWAMNEYKGHKLIVHDGANIGFRSIYARFGDDGLSILILINTDEANPDVIAGALADYYFRK